VGLVAGVVATGVAGLSSGICAGSCVSSCRFDDDKETRDLCGISGIDVPVADEIGGLSIASVPG